MRPRLIIAAAFAALLLGPAGATGQPIGDGVRLVVTRADSSLIGGILLAADSTTLLLRTTGRDTAPVALSSMTHAALIEPRPSVGSASIVLGIGTGLFATALMQDPNLTPLRRHDYYLAATFGGLFGGSVIGAILELSSRQPRTEHDAATDGGRRELVERARRALAGEHHLWSAAFYAGVVTGSSDRRYLSDAGYLFDNSENAYAYVPDLTLLRRVELARRVGGAIDLAIAYAPLAQPAWTGSALRRVKTSHGTTVYAQRIDEISTGAAWLAGARYDLRPGSGAVPFLRLGLAAGPAWPEVRRDGERVVRDLRPAAMASLDVVSQLGNFRVGIAGDYLLVGAIEMPEDPLYAIAAARHDPSSLCLGILFGVSF